MRNLITVLLMLLVGCSTVPEKEKVEVEQTEQQETRNQPVKQTQDPEAVNSVFKQFPNAEQGDVILRMARGIPKWKETFHHGWWECGVQYKHDEEQKEAALIWAYRIVELANEYSDDEFTMNPWGIAGTVANESGFDKCALGEWLREWAYEEKAMKKKRGGAISHSIKELRPWLFKPKVLASYQRTGFDCGPMQELWKCNEEGFCRSIYWDRDTPSISFDKMFTMDIHFDWNVRELRRRARVNNTDRPWGTWRTGKYAKWYDKKVTRWARYMGAKKGEI